MKKLSAVLLTLALLVLAFTSHSASPPTRLESCSCTAPDGSCSASISCKGGCVDWCGSGGDCYAQCAGFLQVFGMETTLQMHNARYPQLVSELARLTGSDVAFTAEKPDSVFNAEYNKAVLWDVLDMLSDRGTVQIAGQDFEKLRRLRKVLLSGRKLSLCVRNTPVNTFINDLASLTGLSFRIVDGRPMAAVTVKLHDVTLDEIVTKVSEQTGTKIVEEGVDPGPR
jgi:hypothetical protein